MCRGATRAIAWILGLGALFAIGALLPWGEPWRPLIPLTLGLALAVAGLLREFVALARHARIPPAPPIPEGARPADGAVAIASMAGVRATPNPVDPRFRRFEGREPDASIRPEPLDHDPARATPPLLGRIVLISVFIGRDGRAWSEAEIARSHASMLRAAAWIERQAMRWDQPVNLEVADTYFAVVEDEVEDVEIGFWPKGEEMQPFEAQAVTKALTSASRAATQLGFHDAVAWFSEINPRVAADVRVWLLHPRQAGHSLAVPLDDTMLAGVSLAVCYAREANFPEPLDGPPFTDPVTIVHELLHLFGASDKYGVPLRAFAPRSVTHREVMRLDETSLLRLQIDPLTAREIGWLRPE